MLRVHTQAQTFWESTNGPTGATAVALAFTSTGDLLAGTSGTGVFALPTGASSWVPMSTGLTNQNIYALLGLQNGVVVAGSGQGVARTTDGGQHWNPTSLDFGVNVSLVARSNTDLFVGLADGNAGVLRSLDGGVTWTQPGLSGYLISALAFDQQTNTLYAGMPANGIFRSTDAGVTWAQVNTGLLDTLVLSLALNSSGHLFAGTGTAVFRSTNRGVSWSSASAGMPNAPKNAIVVNAAGHLFASSGTQGVFRSIDNGASWNSVNTGLTNLDVRSLSLAANGTLYAGTGNGTVFRSTGSTIPPAAPALLFPADSAVNQSVNLQLRWNNSPQADAYRLQVSADPQFTTTIVDDTTLTTTIRTIGPLANGTTYYWRVNAKNIAGTSGYSSRRFTTVSSPLPPPAPVLVSPPDGASDLTIPVMLQWRSSGGAATYRMQLAADSTFAVPDVDATGLTDTVFVVTDLLEATTYYWHVSATNATGTSTYSTRWQFQTAGVPAIQLGPSIVNFGDVTLGSTLSDTVTIFSLGTAPLVVDSLRIAGADASEFSIFGSQGPFPPVNSQDSIRVTMQFIPAVTGPKAAFLLVHTNANTSPDTVSLVGRGTNPALRVSANGLPVVNGTVGIGVKIPVGIATVSESLYVRNAGQTTFESFPLAAITTDSFFVLIPPGFLNIRGVEYYVVITDVQGFPFTFPDLNPVTNPAILRVAVVNAQPSFPLPVQQYRMVSAPLELRQTQPFSLFADDFGPYQRNIWRLFRWENGGYAEHPQIAAAVVPGNAVWVITHAGGFFDTDTGRSVLSSSPYILTLPPNDWTQVANPFAFPVDWRSITKSGSVKGPYYFDGTTYVLDTTSALVPWEGYFVFNDEAFPVTLTVPVLEASPAPPLQKQETLAGEYTIRFSVQGTGNSASSAYLGCKEGATDQYDAFDFPAPPLSPGTDMKLAIDDNGRECMVNFKSPSQQGAWWDLKLSSNEYSGQVSLRLGQTGELPSGHHIYVYDTHDERVVACDGRIFVVDDLHGSRILKVIVGTEGFAHNVLGDIPLQPIEFGLSQNYPNPFNPQTTIQYQLAKKSHVLMEIFNVLGQRVRLLIDEEVPTGFHSIVWDGRNDGGMAAGSGIYFYRMSAGEFVASHKLILVR